MQKIRNTYVLPTYPEKEFKVSQPKIQIQPKDSFEQAHTLLFLVQFVIRNYRLLLLILFVQIGSTIAFVSFSPIMHQAACTILIQDVQQIGLNANYFHLSPTPQRFVALTSSDVVRQAVLNRIIQHDHVSHGKASDILNQGLNLSIGNEGEISVSFDHPDPVFAKEIVLLIIQKSIEVNRVICERRILPIYLYSKKRLSDLDLELKSLKFGKGQQDYEHGLAINNEKYTLQQKLYAIESDMQMKSTDEYFVLNELSVDEMQKKSWMPVLGVNLAIFLCLIYASLLYKAVHFRIRSFIRLATKN